MRRTNWLVAAALAAAALGCGNRPLHPGERAGVGPFLGDAAGASPAGTSSVGVAGAPGTAPTASGAAGVALTGAADAGPNGAAGTIVSADAAADAVVPSGRDGGSDRPPGGAAAASPGGGVGEWIFFDGTVGDRRDIYAVRVDDTTRRRITRTGAFEPAVSPDGSTLAYSAYASGSGQEQIFLMALPNGVPSQLTHDTSGYARQAAWSPDGTHLAFVRGDGLVATIALIARDGTGQITVGHPAEGEQLAHPSFARDGTLLYDGGDRIHRLDLATGVSTALVPSSQSYTTAEHPSVTPDGKSFVFDMTCDPIATRLLMAPLGLVTDPCHTAQGLSDGASGAARSATISSSGHVAAEFGSALSSIGVFDVGGAVHFVTGGAYDDHDPTWAPASTPVP